MTKPRALHLPGTILSLLFAIGATASPAIAEPRAQATPSGVASGWGYADFDGDSIPDLVELRRTFLELRLSTGKELRLASALGSDDPGAEIIVVDLDDDHDFDVVVRNRFLQQHSDIWINDGDGLFSKSATRDFSFPFEHGSWSQSPTLDPGIAIIVKNSKQLEIRDDDRYQAPSLSGRTLYTFCAIWPTQDHTDTTHLRGPPISSLR